MSTILDRIDNTLDGLCPCGATPRDGSAYCGDDCVPNWRGEDTISDLDGTAMRWSPTMSDSMPAIRINTQEVVAAVRALVSAFAGIAEALKPLAENLRSWQVTVNAPVVEPEHPLARMTARRANLVHGPQGAIRPPRVLGAPH